MIKNKKISCFYFFDSKQVNYGASLDLVRQFLFESIALLTNEAFKWYIWCYC